MSQKQENPYRSPDSTQPPGDAQSVSGRIRSADTALVGLLYGGTIGAASGAAAAVCWLGWTGLEKMPLVDTPDALSSAEVLISAAVARVVVMGCLAGAAGAVVGTVMGMLAATARPGLRRHLTTIGMTASSLTAVASVFVWFGLCRFGAHADFRALVELSALAAIAGGIGGCFLSRTLSARADAPFSSPRSGIQ